MARRLGELQAEYQAGRSRTLTTRLHVVGPTYVGLEVAAKLALRDDAVPATATAQARQALRTFFDPFSGGPDGTGWPFGRDVCHRTHPQRQSFAAVRPRIQPRSWSVSAIASEKSWTVCR